MRGAIAGDIIGSPYEGRNIRRTDFSLFSYASRFTDDTVLTVALADSILTGENYTYSLHRYFRRYPRAGYGGAFNQWALSGDTEPYNSWGNGSAMRVSPVGWAYATLEEVLQRAEISAAVTHNHPEGIKGAQAVAAAIFLARTGHTKAEIQEYVESTFGYPLDDTLERLRATYTFAVSCQGSVPQAIMAFLQSDDFESTVRNAISIGGDSDTIACIAGSIAHAFYGDIPDAIWQAASYRLDAPLLAIISEFCARYGCG